MEASILDQCRSSERKSCSLHMVAAPCRGKTTISTKGPSRGRRLAAQCRKLSLVTRLIRLRPTAVGSILLETAIPKREQSPLLILASTRKQRSEVAWFLRKTLLKSVGFKSLWVHGKVGRPAFTCCSLPVCPACMVTNAGFQAIQAQGVRQADRRCLPLARRALMMARPARVDMRARKPCLRARFRRLG